MSRKRYTGPEQIISMLREAEVALAHPRRASPWSSLSHARRIGAELLSLWRKELWRPSY